MAINQNIQDFENFVDCSISMHSHTTAIKLISKKYEDDLHELAQERTLYLRALEYAYSLLEVDSYQGHAFDIERMRKTLADVLGIAPPIKKIPQIVEKDGKFHIEQIAKESL